MRKNIVNADIMISIDSEGKFNIQMQLSNLGVLLVDEQVSGSFVLEGTVLVGSDLRGAIGLLAEGKYIVLESVSSDRIVIMNSDMSLWKYAGNS